MALTPASEVVAAAQVAERDSAGPTAARAAGGSILPPTPAWVALHTGDAAAAAAAAATAGAVSGSGLLFTSEKEQQHQPVAYGRFARGEQQQQRIEKPETKAAASAASPLCAATTTTSSTVVVAACGLSQWALDFKGNCIRVEESMRRAQAAGASLRVGPELELSGYGCEDHFLEEDTLQHSWESLAALLSTNATDNLLCEVGIAVSYESVRYNCRAWLLNRRVLLLRPSTVLRDYGNYHESRYFSAWRAAAAPSASNSTSLLEEYALPSCVTRVNGQTYAPFGVAVLECRDCVVGSVFLEELHAAASGVDNTPASLVCVDVDIICCGTAAHFEVGQYERRLRAVQQASRYCVAVYSNQHGCDGSRLFFDGAAAVCAAGEVLGIVRRFSFEEVQVVAAAVDLSDLRAIRASAPAAWKQKQPQQQRLPIIHAGVTLCGLASSAAPAGLTAATAALAPPAAAAVPLPLPPALESTAADGTSAADATQPGYVFVAGGQEQGQQQSQQQHNWGHHAIPRVSAEEETARTAACWLWDCLRRSGARGFFLALSGGADSAAVAAVVALMCKGIISEVHAGHVDVMGALERVLACRCRRTGTTSNVSSSTSSSGGSLTEVGDDSSGGEVEGGEGGGEAEEEVRFPLDAKELCHALLYTCYMSTHHSSLQTRGLAASLAEQLGSFHLAVGIDAIVAAFANVMASVRGSSPRFVAEGGTAAEDVALQNIQARIRMSLAYFMAQLLPPSAFSSSRSPLEPQRGIAAAGEGLAAQSRGSNVAGGQLPQLPLAAFAAAPTAAPSEYEKREGSFLLVLGTANADEGLRGYFTKYDASSADINPIGSMGKLALRRLLLWAAQPTILACPALYDIAAQAPTAELRPATLSSNTSAEGFRPQTDEEDMGMTYRELADYGRLRKTLRCGPVSMFKRLIREWRGSAQSQQPSTIAQKVVHFFSQYGRHRHKTCTLTPALHIDPSNAEDSRFDPRPFLYPPWNVQFEQIRKIAVQLESSAPIYGASYAQFRS